MIFLNEEQVNNLLNWDDTLEATTVAMKSISKGKIEISQRVFSSIFDTPKWMVTMSGYLEDENYGAWICKILSGNSENTKLANPLPSFSGNILVLDQNTGILKAIIDGREITNYRTAAASAIATKYLHTPSTKPQVILSILGCGEQGRAHAKAFHHYFQFQEIRLWNRTGQKAIDLAQELNKTFNTLQFKVFEKIEECVKNADVIITATTPGSTPIVKYEWIKRSAHINSIGVPVTKSNSAVFELDDEIYKHAHIYMDHRDSANRELAKLRDLGADLKAEVGEVILENIPTPHRDQLTVFQSLGMAVQDCAMARMVLDKYLKQNN